MSLTAILLLLAIALVLLWLFRRVDGPTWNVRVDWPLLVAAVVLVLVVLLGVVRR